MRRVVVQLTTIPITAAAFLLRLADHLRAGGWEVLFASAAGPEARSIAAAGFSHYALPLSRRPLAPRNLLAISTTWKLLDRLAPDVLHVHTPVAAAVGRIAARSLGMPVVYTVHGLPRMSVRAGASIYNAIERRLARTTTAFVTLTDTLQRTIVREWGLDASRVEVQGVGGMGVDLDRYRPPSASERREAKARYGLREDDFVVGFVGRFVAEKGVLDLAAALSTLRPEAPQMRALFVGGQLAGDRGAVTETEITSHGLEGIVVFAGLVDDASRPMAAMDCLILPSYREGFGLVLAEAQCMAIPVVAAENDATSSVVQAGVTGLVVPPGDVGALAAAVKRLYHDELLRISVGAAAAEFARGRFGQDRVFSLYTELYQRVAGQAADGERTRETVSSSYRGRSL